MEPSQTPAPKGEAAKSGSPKGAGKAPVQSASARQQRGVLKRSIDWVWGTAPTHTASEDAPVSAKAIEYERRARLAVELARRALEPPEPFSDGAPDALACGLYHQAITWALTAQLERRRWESKRATKSDETSAETSARESAAGESQSETAEPANASAQAVPRDLGELWSAADPAGLLAEANVPLEDGIVARDRIAECSFADYADWPVEEQARWAPKLRMVAEGLLYGLEVTGGRYNPPWLARTLRVGLVLVVLAGLAWGGFSIKEWATELDNVARGKPWVISSTFPAGCRSPAQKCMESPNFFFHTQDQNQPWMEIDLGTVQRISSVKVKNRPDCCAERAVPLVLEVSTDGQKWTELARKNEVFGTWHAKFAPVDVRWTRLRVARKSMLHLQAVDIYK